MKSIVRKMIMGILAVVFAMPTVLAQRYEPTEENIAARREFTADRFGVFIHWGIYSMYAQGEWYLNAGLNEQEYAKAADAFFPHRFNADEWVRAIKDAGAKYITFTSRHHDSFSMFKTAESDYNIVDATPFRRDVVNELSEACRREGMKLHLYYSILDWRRADYPIGRTGLRTGRQLHPDYDAYFRFMKNQVKELLSNYGPIRGIWLDGHWDHDNDTVPFDWRMTEFYRYIHSLNPACLIGNNHHISPIEGEDFQMFERDLPGENKAGLSGQDISNLPLEMCQTMNGMWGYKVADQNYKSSAELIQLLVRAAGKGSNLLLNIGPQPNGELPTTALERLKEMGKWMRVYGGTVYGTTPSEIGEQEWGTTTQKGKEIYLHVFSAPEKVINFPMKSKILGAFEYNSKKPLAFMQSEKQNITLVLPSAPKGEDYVITLRVE